jgi:hypothetical protein
MIERHLARAPTMPSTAYGADYNNYAGLQAPYVADAHYAQFTSEQYARGGGAGVGIGESAVAAAGAYGPYAAYSAQQQHPQYPHTHARYQNQPQMPQQYAEQYALNKPMPPAPNPFSVAMTTTAAAAVAAAHTAAASTVRSGSTTPPLAGSTRRSSQGSEGSLSGSSGTFLNRQPTQTQHPQPQQAVYADVQRDVKGSHPAPLMVRNATPTKEDGGSGKTKGRDTVYDIADAYGGI